MFCQRLLRSVGLALLGSGVGWCMLTSAAAQPPDIESDVTQGALRVKRADGRVVECPLQHTDVDATITGFIARVKVTQTFHNPFDEPIEAVYVFPLPHTGAVDQMTMILGPRRIVGVLERREVARRIYEEALAQGRTASLLEQERPNVFTQSVGNIQPGQDVHIEISYVDVLKYDLGVYEFHFPMVVGPRYNPAGFTGGIGAVPQGKEGASGQPVEVSYLPPGERNGHDISLQVRLDAGVPIQNLEVPSHQAEIEREGESGATVKLSPADSIPNKAFVLRYGVVGEKPEMALLSQSSGDDGYFLLMIQPKLDQELEKAPPRELCFLLDVSGSMRGAPTAKVQEAMREFFQRVKPNDTLQVITFASQARSLFGKPVPATEDNLATALNFTDAQQGGGGTEMLKGIQMVLAQPVDPERVRIVIMLTDGYIGNEAEIIAEVGRRCGDAIRFWTIGIGSDPNRFLLDGVAQQGGGMAGVLGLSDDPAPLVGEIMERIHRAQLADVEIDWGGLNVYDLYPTKMPELWAGRPIILFGRYEQPGRDTITIRGTVEGKPIEYTLAVDLKETGGNRDVLAATWARHKIADLEAQTYGGAAPEVIEEITQTALEYRLMSPYTSFVAVDEQDWAQRLPPAHPPRRVRVAVPLPEGVSYEGVFGPMAEGFEATAAGEVGRKLFGIRGTVGGKQPMTRYEFEKARVRLLDRAREVRMGLAYRAPARGAHRPVGLPGAGGRMAPTLPPAARRSVSLGADLPILGALFEAADERWAERMDSGQHLLAQLFQGWAPIRHTEAQEALKEAQALQEKGEREAALRRAQHVYLLETVPLSVNPWNDDGTATAAAQFIETLQDERGQAWAKDMPALANRLDLVLRRQPLEAALAQVAQAGGVAVTVVEGSLEDARTLLRQEDLQVIYLDLRNATVAQALTWLLEPFHLTWQVGGEGAIQVGSARRLDGVSPWVYPVGDWLIPTPTGLGEDRKAAVATAERAAQEFLLAVRVVLGQTDEGGLAPGSAVLLSPDGLLVYGDAAAHARVAALLAALSDPKADPAPVANRKLSDDERALLTKVQREAVIRWTSRAEERAARPAARRRAEARLALRTNAWPLLAAACVGATDREALTRLQAAWDAAEPETLLAEPGGWWAWRALWIVTEAQRSRPADQELAALAGQLTPLAVAQGPAILAALKQSPDDPAAYLSVLYFALAQRHDTPPELASGEREVQPTLRPVELLTQGQEGSPLAPLRAIAAALLTQEIDPAAFVKAVPEEAIQGDDLVVLHALAARKLGGVAWERCRETRVEVNGRQPLDGAALLIVNRLTTPRLALLRG